MLGQAEVAAALQPGLDKGAFIGAFYGNYFFWVNVAAVLLQAFVVSRLVKHTGLTGVLLIAVAILRENRRLTAGQAAAPAS